jgi:hypothetical protein
LTAAAVDLMLHFEEQSGAGEHARDEADRLWPAIVAAQRLAFRILAACWEFEASGKRPIDETMVGPLDLDLATIRNGADGPAPVAGRFLGAEIATLREALVISTRGV